VRHAQAGDPPAPSPRCRGGKHAAPMCRQGEETNKQLVRESRWSVV
jgi:hypothetical protein